jgi:GTPase SAR1 family protein
VIRIGVVGEPSVGKSSLIRYFAEEGKFSKQGEGVIVDGMHNIGVFKSETLEKVAFVRFNEGKVLK